MQLDKILAISGRQGLYEIESRNQRRDCSNLSC